MLLTRKGCIAVTIAVVALLTAGCQEADLLSKIGLGARTTTEAQNLEPMFGPVSQRIQVAEGWAVLTEAKEGVRELGYVTVSGRSVQELAPRHVIEGAAEAELATEKGLVVVSTRKSGAPQYAAFKPGPTGLEPVDYYAAFVPEPTRKTGHTVVVNKRLNALWHFENGRLAKVYRVATGRQTALPAPTWQDYRTNFFTPEGTFTLSDFKLNPPYHALKPGDKSFAGGASGNPLGTRWMGFSVLENDNAGIWGIHGTAEPEKIGTWASDGCIRMYTEQAEELFERLKGHSVTVQIVGG